MLVHFPIAFYFLEMLMIILWVIKQDSGYQRFSVFSFKLGYAFMLVTMAAGLFDAGGLDGVRGAVKRHVMMALVGFTIYTARAVFYWVTRKEPEKYRFRKLAGAIVGNAVVTYAGFLGGLLVYQ